jgi:hypothetical protein
MIFASFEKNGDDESRGHRGTLRQRPGRTTDRKIQGPKWATLELSSPHRWPSPRWRTSSDNREDHPGATAIRVYGYKKPHRHDEDERPKIKRGREPVRAMTRSELYQYYKGIGLLREFYRLYPNPKG